MHKTVNCFDVIIGCRSYTTKSIGISLHTTKFVDETHQIGANNLENGPNLLDIDDHMI